MESTLSIIASICGIIGFIVSLLSIQKVKQLKKIINNSDITGNQNNSVNVSGKTNIQGDFTGRDKN